MDKKDKEIAEMREGFVELSQRSPYDRFLGKKGFGGFKFGELVTIVAGKGVCKPTFSKGGVAKNSLAYDALKQLANEVSTVTLSKTVKTIKPRGTVTKINDESFYYSPSIDLPEPGYIDPTKIESSEPKFLGTDLGSKEGCFTAIVKSDENGELAFFQEMKDGSLKKLDGIINYADCSRVKDEFHYIKTHAIQSHESDKIMSDPNLCCEIPLETYIYDAPTVGESLDESFANKETMIIDYQKIHDIHLCDDAVGNAVDVMSNLPWSEQFNKSQEDKATMMKDESNGGMYGNVEADPEAEQAELDKQTLQEVLKKWRDFSSFDPHFANRENGILVSAERNFSLFKSKLVLLRPQKIYDLKQVEEYGRTFIKTILNYLLENGYNHETYPYHLDDFMKDMFIIPQLKAFACPCGFELKEHVTAFLDRRPRNSNYAKDLGVRVSFQINDGNTYMWHGRFETDDEKVTYTFDPNF